jgi:hypothetical protein
MNHDVEALKTFLDQQPEKPRLHINGGDFPFAILSVDYGQPLSGVLISSERGNELTSLMRIAAKTMTKRRGSIRVNFDNSHGVFYASMAS